MPYAFNPEGVLYGGGVATATTIVLSGPITVAAGDTIFAMFDWVNTSGAVESLISVTDNLGNTYSKVGSTGWVANADPVNSENWVARNATAGACTITGNLPVTRDSRGLMAMSISGLSTNAAIVSSIATVPNTSTAANACSGTSVTPPASPALVLSVAWSAGTSSVVGTGFTLAPGFNTPHYGNIQERVEHQRVTSTAPIAATYTNAVTDAFSTVVHTFVLQEAGAAGTAKPTGWKKFQLSTIFSAVVALISGPPGKVTALSVGAPTSTTQPLSWTAPGSGGAPASYTVEYKLSSASAWTSVATGAAATSYTVTGLVSGLAYDFRVTATNGFGSGAASLPKSGWTAVAVGAPSTTTFTYANALFGFNGAFWDTGTVREFDASTNERLTHWVGYVVGTACSLVCGGGATQPFLVSVDGAAYTAPVITGSLNDGTGSMPIFAGLADGPHLIRITANDGYTNGNWWYRTGAATNTFVVTGASPGLSAGPDLGAGVASNLSYVVTDPASPLAPNYITKAAAANFVTPAANVPTLTNTFYLRGGSVAFNATMRDLWVSASSAMVFISIDGGVLTKYDTVATGAGTMGMRKVNFEFDSSAQHKYQLSVEANTFWVRIGGPGAAFGAKPVLNLACQVGDSITEGINWSLPSTGSVDVYGYSAALGAVGLASGVSGKKVNDLTAALTSVILVSGLAQQKVFVIAIGANDNLTTTGPTDFPNTGVAGNFGFDYQQCIDKILAHSPSAKVICRGLIPVEQSYAKDAAIAACVASRANANVVFQSAAAWTGGNVSTGTDGYNANPTAGDGQHPTPFGYKLFAAYQQAEPKYIAAFATFTRYSYLGQGVTATGDLTLLSKHASDRYIYVKPTGNDTTGDGLSHATAYATMAKAWAVKTSGQGDWILFAGGTTFTDTFDASYSGHGKAGRSAVYPTVITSYDPADPMNTAKFGNAVSVGTNPSVAKVMAGSGASGCSWAIDGYDAAHAFSFLVITGLYFYRPTAEFDTGNSGLGLFLLGHGDGVLIENNLFLKTPIELTGPGGGFNYVGGALTNGCIRRNGSTTAVSNGTGHHSGVHADQAPGLVIEDNIIDHSGWTPGGRGTGNNPGGTADTFKHGVYPGARTKNMVVRRNVISRASATGAQGRGGATFTDNVFGLNPYGLNVSSVDYTSYSNIVGYGLQWTDAVCTVTGNLFSGAMSVQGTTIINGGNPMYFYEVNPANAHIVQNNLIVSAGSGYVGADLSPIKLFSEVNSRPYYNLLTSFAVNTTDPGSNGINTGDIAIVPTPCTINFDNNLIARWGSVSYATSGSNGSAPGANSITRTNNVWDNEAASGSNVLLSSVSAGYLAPTRDVAAYAAAFGYASEDALYDFASLHPETNWALNIRNWVFAGYNR